MQPPLTSRQIKRYLADEIKTAISSDGSINSPKVYPWNPMKPFGYEDRDRSKVLAEWAGLFAYTPSVDKPLEKKTYGWLIKRADRMSEMSNETCEKFSWAFDIWGMYGFSLGNETTNSEDLFEDEIEKVCTQINSNTVFELFDVEVTHGGLQVPVISLIKAGDTAVHFAGARLEVEFGG